MNALEGSLISAIFLALFRLNKFTYWLTRSQAILHVALEDNTVRFRKPEGLVHGLKSVTVGSKRREDAGVDWTSFVVDDLECALGVLGHRHTAPGKNAVGC